MADIKTLVERIKAISLNHKEVNSFHVGNTWDMATGKDDVYPNVWVEFPVLIEYTSSPRGSNKVYTLSIDVLDLAKNDDTWDEMSKESQCEQIADQLLQAYQKYISQYSNGRMVGLTVKNINADKAVGVRIDVQFQTNRECDFDDNFDAKMTRE